MSVTRIKRKLRKDRSQSKVRKLHMQIQGAKPVIKNVDIEKIKEEFKTNTGK